MTISDLKIKLTSRKFWAMVAVLVVSILTLFNCSENVIVQITSMLTSLGAVVAYILGETCVDKARMAEEKDNEPT